MIGITSYGAYVPPTRLPLATLAGRPAKEGGPEKAVAWSDEDAITLGVQAARNALRGFDRAAVDAVFFASTTLPFAEKQAAALAARALDLGRALETADFGGSLRAGMAALRAAFDAVRAGSVQCALVIASDCRLAAPGSALEAGLGDGACAFLVRDGDAVATPTARYAVADEIVDVWRSAGDPFVHAWEDRFVVQEGFTPRVVEAVSGLCERSGRGAADYTRIALYAPDARSHGTVARALGLAKEQLQDPFFGRLGNAGAAFAPLQLAASLESAKPGESLLVAAYGDGAEAIAFDVTEHVEKLGPRRGVEWHLQRRRPVARYDQYLKARELQPTEWGRAGDPGLSATIHFRERDDDLSFRAQQCRRCQALQFPAQRVCESCFAKDEFDSVPLAERTGKLVTYTFDYFFPTPQPPTVVTVVDVDGARVHLQLVNCPPDDVAIDLPVEFVFRRIHTVGGRPNYYWKATPAEASGPEGDGDGA
ncbi:MAG: OB-fold domain-containing protein [Proteobacteria bacterium]|nr:OB-fold domain-containing protein [Pseudomonadota bacterium]